MAQVNNSNYYSMCAIGGTAEESRRIRAETIGFVCAMARSAGNNRKRRLDDFLKTIDAAIDLNQIKLYFNNHGQCMGYVTWAYLSPAVEQRLVRVRNLSVSISERVEGTSLWILDFVVPRGALQYVLADLRDVVFADEAAVTYARIKSGRFIPKRLSRDDGGSFFSRTCRNSPEPCATPT